MLDLLLYALIAVVILTGLFFVADAWWKSDPVRAFDTDYSTFMRECRRNGLSYQEAMDEWEVRTSFVKLRGDASDAVRRDPANWKRHLDEAINRAVDDLATVDKLLAKRLEAMVGGLTYGDILYPHEVQMVDRQPLDLGSRRGLSAERMAALRVLR